MTNKKGKAAFFEEDAFNIDKIKEENTQEVQQAQEEYTRSTIRGTQGRKGCKMPRINMAFEPDLHEWIQRSARRNGITMTNFVNSILREKMDSEK